MKKALFISTILSIVSVATCFGAENKYTISEKNITFTIDSEDFDVLKINDEYILLNPDYSFDNIAQEEDIASPNVPKLYCYAIDYDNDVDFSVKASERSDNDTFDFNYCNEGGMSKYIRDSNWQAAAEECGANDVYVEGRSINGQNCLYITIKSIIYLSLHLWAFSSKLLVYCQFIFLHAVYDILKNSLRSSFMPEAISLKKHCCSSAQQEHLPDPPASHSALRQS